MADGREFLAFCRSSDEHLVHLDMPRHFVLQVSFCHGMTHALDHGPGRRVTDADLFSEKQRRQPSLVRCHEKQSDEPLLQRRARPMEDRSCRRRKKAVAAHTSICPGLFFAPVKVLALAMRALQAIGPTNTDEIFLTRILGTELEELHDRHATIFVGHAVILLVFVP